MQAAVIETKSALGRVLSHVQTEEPERAEQGLAILLACALGECLFAALHEISAATWLGFDRKLLVFCPLKCCVSTSSCRHQAHKLTTT